MADNDCWGAFGSDSDSEDHDDDSISNPFEPAADAISLAVTQYFVSLVRSSGTLLTERVIRIGGSHSGIKDSLEMMMDRVGNRGLKVYSFSEVSDQSKSEDLLCDGAILLKSKNMEDGALIQSSLMKGLLPGGILWLVISLEGDESANGVDDGFQKRLGDYSDDIWDMSSASLVYSSSRFQVISIQKRSCVINAWSCPWMDKQQQIRNHSSTLTENEELRISANDTYLQYERKVARVVTINPSLAERTRKTIGDYNVTVLTDANVKRATEILQQHGFVIIKGLLPMAQTIQWGDAVLSDFESAVARLKCHPTRPVDLMNPHARDSIGDNQTPTENQVFEPLSYKEMAMREDLRVDLRSGPEMESLRRSQNEIASDGLTETTDLNNGPTMIDAGFMGTVKSWRFHPSLLAIVKATFNPRDDSLFKGNFGRWNFGGAGPDGSPQPFRLGQVGSVLSCPGSGDQAIHADTPHLFEHTDCLPCHYLNVFTPGYVVRNELNNNCYQHEFDDSGIWTGNSTMGGTAFVHGSHKLSVTAQLLSDDDPDTDARQLLQLRTIRPSLDAGDVLFFDCRTIHYGLANTSQGDKSGNNVNAGRRPMLYLNVSSSWFHDPKNWDDRERIFD